MKRGVSLALLLVFVIVSVAGTGWPVLAAAPQGEKAVSDAKVNINTASKAELMKLDGIGPAVAEKIIEYRKANGPFKRPEDIRKIQGIGKGLWEKNRGMITVE
ncbi:MAG: helix-hairpin-helix domain-containing protein [Candidatus Rokubacteria bacterium]|nr:helix-hairpin-helix domain-containing protein [Candidatus Rokubacteria bacterium]